MPRAFSRPTAKSQTTMPKSARAALGVEPDDALEYVIEKEGVNLRKLPRAEKAHLRALQTTLPEWDTPEDASAFDDL